MSMGMVGLLLMAQCLLISSSLGHAAAWTLLQMPPTPSPSGNATTPMPGSTAPPNSTPAPDPSTAPVPLTTMPDTTSSALPGPIPPSVALPYCTADIQPGSTWNNYDGTYMGVVNIYMVNYGSIDIPAPWTFSIMNPDYLEVFQTWNWFSDGMDSTGKATGYANQYWETIMASGQNQVNIGAIFKGSSPQNFYPRAIAVNGKPCYIQQLR